MRIELQKARQKKKYTHEQVAKKAGIHRATYTHIELGTRNPSLGLALKIAKVLDTTVDDIFLPSDVTKSDKTA
ncbi:MAG TPA: helix-turn-helix transcriptional regulator [Syntrophomonadaceae bacterium]|nr:helix-turn-helix transcriptional regulator [Syntrophomonadaceae bacterium]